MCLLIFRAPFLLKLTFRAQKGRLAYSNIIYGPAYTLRGRNILLDISLTDSNLLPAAYCPASALTPVGALM